MKNPFTVLLLSSACAFGQCSFTFDIASFPGVATNAVEPCTNSVTWEPAASTLDWWDTNGNPHYTVTNPQFQTNCNEAVQRIDAQGSVGNYITNFNQLNQLINLQQLSIGTETGLLNLGLDKLAILTNIAINYNPDLEQIDFGADIPIEPVDINISQNPKLGTLLNWDNAGYGNLKSWIMNDCGFSDETQTNVACYIYNRIVANNSSNGTFYTQGNAEPIADPSCIWAMTNYGWTINY